jgi:hypothetical protein
VSTLLAAVFLPAVTACSGGGSSAEVSPSGSAVPALSQAQARTALIKASDLPAPWAPTGGAGSGNPLFDGRTGKAECQKLLNALRDNDIVGRTAKAKADARFENTLNNSLLSYRVGSYELKAAEDGMALVRGLPQVCNGFTATIVGGTKATVQVVGGSPAQAGEDTAGLTVTMETTVKGVSATVTTEMAAVRIGPNVISISNGGLEGIDSSATARAVEHGAQRLKDVLAGRTPPGLPSQIE